MDILKDLRGAGLLGVYNNPSRKEEAVLLNPEAQNKKDAEVTSQPDENVPQGNVPVVAAAPEKSEDGSIQVTAEVKDKILELHRLSGEIIGMLSSPEKDMKLDKYDVTR